MNFETITSIVGLSSLISVSINIIFNYVEKKQMLKFEKITKEKEHRYQSTLAFMLVALSVKNITHIDLSGVKAHAIENMSDIEIKKFFLEELEAHYIFSHLYAGKEVLEKIHNFIEAPSKENYQETALAMRKDLWS